MWNYEQRELSQLSPASSTPSLVGAVRTQPSLAGSGVVEGVSGKAAQLSSWWLRAPAHLLTSSACSPKHCLCPPLSGFQDALPQELDAPKAGLL